MQKQIKDYSDIELLTLISDLENESIQIQQVLKVARDVAGERIAEFKKIRNIPQAKAAPEEGPDPAQEVSA